MIDVYKLDYSKISKVESISYSRKFLELCSKDSWAVPECKTANERVILEKLFLKYPPLGKKEKRLWNISFCREFDMTMDSNKFHRSTELKNADHYLPLYEGRMVHQFNSSKKKYVKGTGRTAVWESNTSYDGDGATEKASGGGVMCDDVYYVNELDNSHSYYGTAKSQAYDTETWTKLNSVYINGSPAACFMSSDYAVEPIYIWVLSAKSC